MNLLSTKCQDLWSEVEREVARVAEAKTAYREALMQQARLTVELEHRLEAAAVPGPALRAAVKRELKIAEQDQLLEDLAAELEAICRRDPRDPSGAREVYPRVASKRKVFEAQVITEDHEWQARATPRVRALIDEAVHAPTEAGFMALVAQLQPELHDIAAIERWWSDYTAYLRVGSAPSYWRPVTRHCPLVERVGSVPACAVWVAQMASLLGLNGAHGPAPAGPDLGADAP